MYVKKIVSPMIKYNMGRSRSNSALPKNGEFNPENMYTVAQSEVFGIRYCLNTKYTKEFWMEDPEKSVGGCLSQYENT